jgi:copper chaperone
MEKVTLKVDGMSCEHCVKAVTNALAGVGVTDIVVSLKDGTASFTRNADAVQMETIKAAIEEEGFEVQ